jgi:hypothetical protein
MRFKLEAYWLVYLESEADANAPNASPVLVLNIPHTTSMLILTSTFLFLMCRCIPVNGLQNHEIVMLPGSSRCKLTGH